MGTFVAADTNSAGNGSLTAEVIVPTVSVGDTLIFVANRAGSSTSDIDPSSSNGGTFTRVDPADGAARVNGSVSFVFWYRTAVSGDSGSTVTFTSEAATNRWMVGVYVCRGVDPSKLTWAIFTPAGSGTSFANPACTPDATATGGIALGVCIGSINNDASGTTYSTAAATIRAQETHTAASGQNPSLAFLERSFTGTAEVPQIAVTGSPEGDSRVAYTILLPDSGGGSETGEGTGTISVSSTQTSSGAGAIVSSGSDFSLQEGAAGQMNATSLEPDGVTPAAGHWEHVSGDFNLVTLLSSSTDPDATFTAPEI